MSDPERPAQWFGRAFETAAGVVVLPCDVCGTPMWPGAVGHECVGLDDKLVAFWLAGAGSSSPPSQPLSG